VVSFGEDPRSVNAEKVGAEIKGPKGSGKESVKSLSKRFALSGWIWKEALSLFARLKTR
jgi:hypothetical protein